MVKGGIMREFIYKAKQRFLFSGKTYKNGEYILRKSNKLPREIRDKIEFIGIYNG